MLGKAQELLTRLGGNVAESVGVRAGESTRPEDKPVPAPTPATNYKLDRSAGTISPDEVIPDPSQPRRDFDEAELRQLSQDIQARGQLSPIKVRWSPDHHKWMIVFGERRWRAVKMAGLPTIRAIFVDREMSQQEVRAEQIVENVQRTDLNVREKAVGYKTLMDLNGWNASELAAALHVSNATVTKTLAVLNLPEDLQEKVARGQLSASAAYELAKVKDADAQRQLAEQAVAGQLYVDTRKAAKAAKTGGKGRGERRKPTNETFRLAEARVTVSSRRHIGDQGVLDSLLEAAEQVRKRLKEGQRKAG
jgi:ParB family transcriptional regulator, chromosome partitioning protein